MFKFRRLRLMHEGNVFTEKMITYLEFILESIFSNVSLILASFGFPKFNYMFSRYLEDDPYLAYFS